MKQKEYHNESDGEDQNQEAGQSNCDKNKTRI